MRLNKFGVALIALALVAAACGGGGDAGSLPDVAIAPSESPLTVDQTTVPGAPGVRDDATETTGAPSTERPAPDPSRAIAPDFSLNLGDGSTFVLSEETRPVFMVFWAEW
jgi:hypothetical protein